MEMKNNQLINCTVSSCRYNNEQKRICNLNSIIVEPCTNCSSGKAEDESMCGNYRIKLDK